MKKLKELSFIRKSETAKSAQGKEKDGKSKEKKLRNPLSNPLYQLMLNTGQIAGASVIGEENREYLQNKFTMFREERRRSRLKALSGLLLFDIILKKLR